MKYKNQQLVCVFIAAFQIGDFFSTITVVFFLIYQLLKLYFHLGLPLWSRRKCFKIWAFLHTIVCKCVCRWRLLTDSIPGLALLYMNVQEEVGESDLLKSSMKFIQLSDLRKISRPCSQTAVPRGMDRPIQLVRFYLFPDLFN